MVNMLWSLGLELNSVEKIPEMPRKKRQVSIAKVHIPLVILQSTETGRYSDTNASGLEQVQDEMLAWHVRTAGCPAKCSSNFVWTLFTCD